MTPGTPKPRSWAQPGAGESGAGSLPLPAPHAEPQFAGLHCRSTNVPTPQDILRFWFTETLPAQWWAADPDFDARIADRFGALHARAAQAELVGWRSSAEGRLAEVLVLDQFSRNIHRNTPRAFAQDGMALVLAQEALACAADRALPPVQRGFLLMPWMHSESRDIHAQAEPLFRDLGNDNTLNFALRHKAIIDRFGRYPHRNAVLGRESTAEEIEFLKQPGSRF